MNELKCMEMLTRSEVIERFGDEAKKAMWNSGIHRLEPFEFPAFKTIKGKKCFKAYEVEIWKDYQDFIAEHEDELARYDDTFDLPHLIAGLISKASIGLKAFAESYRQIAEAGMNEIDEAVSSSRIMELERGLTRFCGGLEDSIDHILNQHELNIREGVNVSNEP